MNVQKVTVEELFPGAQFTLFTKLCTVTEVTPNDYGLIVVYFVMDEDMSPEITILIVPPDTIIQIHSK